jgi:polyferredoxin
MRLIAALDFKLLHEPLLPVSGTVDLAPFLIMVGLLAAGAALLRRRPKRQALRRVTQTASFLAFVVGLHPCACMVRDLVRGAMAINFDNLGAFQYMMLIVPVATFTMVFGRVFCGWVCPIGFVQEMATRASNWMRRHPNRRLMARIRLGMAAVLLLGTVGVYAFVRPYNFPILQGVSAGYLIFLAMLIMLSVADRRWEVSLRAVRYGSLAFFVLGTAVAGIYLHGAFCVLFVNDLNDETIMLFVGVLFASLVLSQAWCRFLCPEGALLGLLTRLSGVRIRLDRSKCSRCNNCGQVCPVEAIDVGEVDERSCLYCCKCVDTCPTSAIDMAGQTGEDDSAVKLPVLRGRELPVLEGRESLDPEERELPVLEGSKT